MTQRTSREFARAFFSDGVALSGAVILVLLLAAALFAPLIAPQNPYDLGSLAMEDTKLAPGARSAETGMLYLLGTDEQGRDMLSAILYGLRTSLWVGTVSTLLAFFIGSALGLLSGYFGGRVDALLMRIADVQLSFPAILIALILVAVVGQGAGKIIAALVAVQWAFYARTARGAAMVERHKEYVEAASCLGLSQRRIAFGHVLPNCMAPLIVVAALQVASAITLEATLSFLGLGLPITEPSLGLLISNGFSQMLSGKYWISIYPGLALLFTIVAINLVADKLRDLLNPRLQTV
ncbi:MAG: ABC transporter permease [Burkholderiales bacterium]|nr:ABC transporter permease [Burkholderiales bacterium]